MIIYYFYKCKKNTLHTKTGSYFVKFIRNGGYTHQKLDYAR